MSTNRFNDFYSVKDAAAEIGIGYMALHQRIHRNSVKVERPSPRVILIHKNEVERLKKDRGEGSCS